MDLWIEPAIDNGTIGCLCGHTFPIAFTKHEGGDWQAVGKTLRVKAPIAAVLFDDGMIYDFVLDAMKRHPWRKQTSKPTIRIKAGRNSG